MSPLVFCVTLFRDQEDTDMNTIAISKAENRKKYVYVDEKVLSPG